MSDTTKYWIMATRPKTLPAGASPVILGLALAYSTGLNWGVAIATLACCLLMQVGANLVNDYFDAVHGVDDKDRLGPARVTQQGFLEPEKVKAAFMTCFALALAIGVYLVMRGGWVIVAIGLASIAAAYLYTGGPKPLSYLGLGEVLAFVFFGPVAVAGTYYLQTLEYSQLAVIVGMGPGFLSALLMSVNNLRDMKSDMRTDKRTLALTLGEHRARILCLSLLVLSWVVPLIYVGRVPGQWWVLAAPFASQLFRKHWIHLSEAPIDAKMNDVLAAVGKYIFIYSVLLAVGIVV